MLYLENESRDPYFNLAFEEYCLKKMDSCKNCLLLVQNEPTIIVGRFQNTLAQINTETVTKERLHVVRRMTGGGAVYHDRGSLSISLIEKGGDGTYSKRGFLHKLIGALERMGIKVEAQGAYHLAQEGQIFCVMSYYHYRGKHFHQATVYLNTEIKKINDALFGQMDKRLSSLASSYSMEAFKKGLLEYFFEGQEIQTRHLSFNELADINKLTAEKYITWEWNHGMTSHFNLKRMGRFVCGEIEIYLTVDKGLIQFCAIYGDFMSSEDIHTLERKLMGVSYQQQDLELLITEDMLQRHFGELSREEFIRLLLGT